MGDGSTLRVLDTQHGRIGGLICWENYMPQIVGPNGAVLDGPAREAGRALVASSTSPR